MDGNPKRGASQSLTVPFKQAKSDRRFTESIFDPRKEEGRLDRFRECGNYLIFDHCRHVEHYNSLHSANFCRDRMCVTCQWRKSLRIYSSVWSLVDFMIDQEPKRPQFTLLTLTVQNCDIADTGSTLKRMMRAFQKLHKSKFWKERVQGYFRSLEITFNEKQNSVHPHFHVMLHMADDYFHGYKYTKQSEWLEQWRKAYGDYNITQVDIRNLKQKNKFELMKSVCEVVKYSIKPSTFKIKNLSTRSRLLTQLKNDLRGVHLHQPGGSIFKYMKIKDVKLADDEVNMADDPTQGVECPECKKDLLRTWFKWTGKDYDYTRQTTLRYLDDLRNADAVDEWKYQDAERQAIEEKILKRGTFFNRKFDYCNVHDGSFQQ